MNKKWFTGIVVLMGISILGIIGVQLVWMNNAIRIKNELFSRSVSDAMNNTVRKLEDLHNFGVVNRMVFHDSVYWTGVTHTGTFSGNVPPPPSPRMKRDFDTTFHVTAPRPMIRRVKPTGKNSRIEIKVDSDKRNGQSSFTYHFKSDSADNRDVVIIRHDEENSNDVFVTNENEVVVDVDSLYNISMVKIDSVLTTLDTINIVMPGFTQRAQMKAVKLKNMASQVVTEIAEWDVNSIDDTLVQQILTEELQNRKIPIGFEFGILKDSVIVSSQPVSDTLELKSTGFKVNLYPNDIFQKNIQLAVWFPGRDSFIYRSLNWLLVASFLFSLIILVTFGMSVFYILRQKKISEMKSDFINNMTHEFKTPIATISVATDSITNEKVLGDPEKIRYFAGMIKKENTRMNRQVEDILTIARLDKKDFEFRWEPVDVHDIINDAVQGIAIQIEKRGGRTEFDFKAQNPVISTDKIHGTNIFYNLIDNAVKYSVNPPEIKITTVNKNNGILISVQDNGIGMNKAVQARIFERFYRQTSGNIHNVKGFGLGLNYVKAVVEANNGTISVQSEPGKGSRFDVFLPFVRE
ncbi:MAG: sensor histidine kinase [Draconibacterium sp.]